MKAFLVEKTGDKEFTSDIKEVAIPKMCRRRDSYKSYILIIKL
ncbi:MAG: hypothetical protein U5K55_08925 [Aliarcobacter sp.]|nr:hypothetical protein [Aliarcobacter sp.]